MKGRSPTSLISLTVAAALSIVLTGCDSAESRARSAFSEYQAAAAAGNLIEARLALLELVAAEDSVADYWLELGKVQLQLGAYGDAYYAFTRAHELNRSNVDVLGTLTQIALLSGNTDVAEEKAKQLELLAPTHPAVALTYGHVALRRSNLDEADRFADKLLQSFPLDSNAKLLKFRILLARGEDVQAETLLQDQVRAKPDDIGALKALVSFRERHGDWKGVLEAAAQIQRLNPENFENALLVIEAAFLSNDFATARAASLERLRPDAPADQVDSVLSLWAEHWREAEAVNEARRLVRTSRPHQQLAYATYFNKAGTPEDAAALVGNAPQLPITRANTSVNAILADSLALRGRTVEAKRLFESVLSVEPDHIYALRGRAELQLKTGGAKAAIRDAQRLVSILPDSAPDRLLLARAYASAGDQRQLDRTLWDAFHQIPGDKLLYSALRDHVARTGGQEAVRRVTEEFDHQKQIAMTREFV